MSRKDVRTLRDEAGAAAAQGKHKRALECYLELEKREPFEANWPKRAAESYRRLGKNKEAVAAYDRAAERFARGGFLVQSIAVSKIILQIDPQHETTKNRLIEMSEQQDAGRSQAAALADRHRGIAGIEPSQPAAPAPGGPLIPPAPTGAPRGTPVPVAPAELRRAVAGLSEFDPPPPRSAASAKPQVIELPELDPDEPSVELLRPAPAFAPRQVMPAPRPVAPAPRSTRPEPAVVEDATIDIEAAAVHGVYQVQDLGDDELSFDLPALADPDARPGPIELDQGAPLDSVALAGVMPGAQAARHGDGRASGVIVIPLDDEPFDDLAALEISAEIVGPDLESTLSMGADTIVDGDDPIDLALEDLGDVESLPEDGHPVPLQPYSSTAQRALTTTPLFAALPRAALGQLIDRLQLVELPASRVLFRQGDAGQALYVVVDGEVAVLADGPPEVEVARMGPGAFFGEVALVTDQPRTATIRAIEPTQLLAIDRDVVRDLVVRYPEVLKVVLRFLRERLVDALIRTHPLFKPYGDQERRDLVSRFRFLEIEQGAVILARGSRTAGLYALLAGQAEVRREGNALVETLGSGDLFGEISVLTGEPSDVTVSARVKCLALCLPTNDFREIIMTHPLVLSYMSDLVDERRRQHAENRSSHVNLV